MNEHLLHLLIAAIIFAAGFAQAQPAKDVTRVPVVFSGGHDNPK